MARKRNNLAIFVMVIATIAVAMFFVLGNPTDIGLTAGMANDLIAVLPGLFLFFMGMIATVKLKMSSPIVVAAFTVIGVGLAVLISETHTIGIINDAMLAPATLLQIQELIIIVSVLMGGVAYAAGRRN